MACAMNKGKTIFSQIMSLIPERDVKIAYLRYPINYIIVVDDYCFLRTVYVFFG